MFRISNKIGYRLIINIVISITIMIVLVAFSVSIYMSKSMEEELAKRLESQNDFARHRIENLFVDASNYARQLARNDLVIEYLEGVQTREDIYTHPNYELVLDLMESMEESTDQIFLVWIAGERVNYYVEKGKYSDENYDVFERPWYPVALLPKEINYTDPYVEWLTQETVVSSIKTLPDRDGTRNFVVVDFSLNILPDVVKEIDVGEAGEVFIINEDHVFIYHENSNFITKRSVEEIKPELAEWLSKDKSGMDEIKLRGQEYFITIQDINYSDWQIITTISKSEYEEGLRQFTFLLVVTLVLLTALVGFAVWMLINRKLKPIDALAHYSEEIAEGHIDLIPPYEYTELNDEMGTMARSFVTITEVFKQKNQMLEDIVRTQYEEIEQQYHYIIEKEKIASLGVLVAGVAHEINTPLGNGVTTSSYLKSLVEKMERLYEEQKLSKQEFNKILHAMEEASNLLVGNLERASDLVKQFKSIATNQNIESLKHIELHEEVDKVLTSLRPTTKKKKLEIVNAVDPQILMTTYPGALSQVFTNLIINSMHHGYGLDEFGVITIKAQQEGMLVRITYQDDGKGIEPDILNHIFEPFYTTRRNKNNSGLGMYITHNLVNQNLSGTIHCESQPGQGVSFHITIPLELVDDK